MHQCICSDYPSGHFYRSKSALYNHQRALRRLDHENMEPDEDFDDSKVLLHIYQLKIRILIDVFDIDSTPAQNITPEENDTLAIGDDISNNQSSADEPLEDLSDNMEMDSGSTLLKHIPCFQLILFIDDGPLDIVEILETLNDSEGNLGSICFYSVHHFSSDQPLL
jgi:hypothetical protein